MHGLHLTADLHDCRCDRSWLTDGERLIAHCARIVRQTGLTIVDHVFHRFPPVAGVESGVTATILIAQSHVCIHTWPEHSAVTLDVYVCHAHADHSPQAEAVLSQLLSLFDARHVERHALRRGTTLAARAVPP